MLALIGISLLLIGGGCMILAFHRSLIRLRPVAVTLGVIALVLGGALMVPAGIAQGHHGNHMQKTTAMCRD